MVEAAGTGRCRKPYYESTLGGLRFTIHDSDSRFTIMYCPSCGSEERQMSQYCRACGTDLRPMRVSLERPDSVTASAVTAREEIGRAMAAKIREVDDAHLHRIAEDVLPQIEKFLESPEEKRLRRMRNGVVTAACGLGAGILALLVFVAIVDTKAHEAIGLLAALGGLGVITFLIGLGLVLNGILLTKPRLGLKDSTPDAESQGRIDAVYPTPQLRAGSESPELFRSPTTADLARADLRPGSSITEHTTHHLKTER